MEGLVESCHAALFVVSRVASCIWQISEINSGYDGVAMEWMDAWMLGCLPDCCMIGCLLIVD